MQGVRDLLALLPFPSQAYLADADKQDASGVFDNGRSLKQDLEDAFMGALAWADKRGPNGGTAWVNADPDKRQERQQHLERLTLASRSGAQSLAAWKDQGAAAGAEAYLQPDAALVGVQLLLGLDQLPLSLVVLAEVEQAAQGAGQGLAAAGIAVQVVPAPGVVQASLDAAVEAGEPYELPPALTVTVVVAGGHTRAVLLRRQVEVWYHGREAGVSAYEGGRLAPASMHGADLCTRYVCVACAGEHAAAAVHDEVVVKVNVTEEVRHGGRPCGPSGPVLR